MLKRIHCFGGIISLITLLIMFGFGQSALWTVVFCTYASRENYKHCSIYLLNASTCFSFVVDMNCARPNYGAILYITCQNIFKNLYSPHQHVYLAAWTNVLTKGTNSAAVLLAFYVYVRHHLESTFFVLGAESAASRVLNYA